MRSKEKKKIVEEKTKEVKEKLYNSPVELGQSFSYWLGFLRGLEWVQENQERHKR